MSIVYIFVPRSITRAPTTAKLHTQAELSFFGREWLSVRDSAPPIDPIVDHALLLRKLENGSLTLVKMADGLLELRSRPAESISNRFTPKTPFIVARGETNHSAWPSRNQRSKITFHHDGHEDQEGFRMVQRGWENVKQKLNVVGLCGEIPFFVFA